MSLGFPFSVRSGNFCFFFRLGRRKGCVFAAFLAHFPEKGISNCIAHSPMIRVFTASGGALRNWWSVGRGPVQEAKGNLVSPQVRLLSSDSTRVCEPV